MGFESSSKDTWNVYSINDSGVQIMKTMLARDPYIIIQKSDAQTNIAGVSLKGMEQKASSGLHLINVMFSLCCRISKNKGLSIWQQSAGMEKLNPKWLKKQLHEVNEGKKMLRLLQGIIY